MSSSDYYVRRVDATSRSFQLREDYRVSGVSSQPIAANLAVERD